MNSRWTRRIETRLMAMLLNPWRVRRLTLLLTRRSSAGAAAVAADLCLGATGTDTGVPSAGLPPLRHTSDQSRTGAVPLVHCGVASFRWIKRANDSNRTRRGNHVALWPGMTPKDSTSAEWPARFEAALDGDIRAKRFGIPRRIRIDGSRRNRKTCGRTVLPCCAIAGRRCGDISLPHTKYACLLFT